MLSPLVDLLIGLLVLVVLLAIYQVTPNWRIVFLPAYLLLAMAAALGMGMLLAALNAFYRDVRHVLPVLLRLWFFLSPVLFGLETIREKLPDPYETLIVTAYAANPMVSVCAGFRSGLIGTPGPTSAMVLVSVASAGVMLAAGYLTFRRHEQVITDVL